MYLDCYDTKKVAWSLKLFKTDDIKLQKYAIAEELHYNSVLK